MVRKEVRGGTKIRKQYNKMITLKNSWYKCPRCGKESVKRVSASVWVCRSCKTMFAGGMYTFRTPAGTEIARKIAVYKEAQKSSE